MARGKKLLREELYEQPPPGWDEAGIHALLFPDKETVPLTYCYFINGLLNKQPPQVMARDLGWTESALRTELCKVVYKRIKDALGIQRITWHHFAELLKEEGFYHPQEDDLQSELDTISDFNNQSEVSALILSIETSICRILDRNETSSIPEDDLQEFLSQANEYVEQQKYSKALFLYSKIAEQAPLDFPGVLVRIAMTYSKLKRYQDSCSMANFALFHVASFELKGSLYSTLAFAFDEMCRRNPNRGKIRQTLSFYQQAVDFSRNTNAVAAWNMFDFLNHLMERTDSFYEEYKNAAYIALNVFQNAASNPSSNFKDSSHAQLILREARIIATRNKLKEEFLVDKLNEILDQYGHLS